jgi:hypothetical protein
VREQVLILGSEGSVLTLGDEIGRVLFGSALNDGLW